MYRLFADYLDHHRVGEVFFAPADVAFSTTRLGQPDLFVVPLVTVSGGRPERFSDVGRLILAAEVLSPSSARADRVAKRGLFRDEQVPEYWIIDLDARTVERSVPADTRTSILVDELIWHPERAAAPLVIDLVAYFAAVLDS